MMKDKRVLITGATNGIGLVAARELAQMGAEVILVGRNLEKTEKVVNEIKAQTGNMQVDYLIADLSSMSQVRGLAQEFVAKYDRLDVLLNNAGAVFTSRQETVEGNEMTFALNHLSYFLLTNLLLESLKNTARYKGEARILNVSSNAHDTARHGMSFDDIQYQESYNGFGVYAESKLANLLFTYKLAQGLQGTGVTVNAIHPGIVETGFGHNNGSLMHWVMKGVQFFFARSPEEGAETLIYLASSAEVEGVTGKYWTDNKIIKSSPISYNRDQQERLWNLSEELLGLESLELA